MVLAWPLEIENKNQLLRIFAASRNTQPQQYDDKALALVSIHWPQLRKWYDIHPTASDVIKFLSTSSCQDLPLQILLKFNHSPVVIYETSFNKTGRSKWYMNGLASIYLYYNRFINSLSPVSVSWNTIVRLFVEYVDSTDVMLAHNDESWF